MKRRQFLHLGAGSIVLFNAGRVFATAAKNAAQLRIIATTDVHSFLTDFDYYKDQPTDKFGLTRAASLIKTARSEVKNSVLVDNGDLIQGNPIADYQVKEGIVHKEPHPAILALNALAYDAGTIGNHEFNYGLEYLEGALAEAKFPIVCANIVKAGTDLPYYSPYVIQEKVIIDDAGHQQTVKIGYVGFVPPQVMVWDKAHLSGKVEAKDIVETARRYVPEMVDKGADVIVALAHTGPSDAPYEKGEENAAFHLADVEGIDAIIFGHAHRLFPDKTFAQSPQVNLEKGTQKDVPSAMAGYWANNISVVDLKLAQDTNGKWAVSDGRAEIRPIYDVEQKKAMVEADAELSTLLADVHNKTRHFVSQPIGQSQVDLYSFLALVQDDPTVQIVNQAQIAYAKALQEKMPELQGLPILSAAAPFKVGGRKNDPTGYTEVDKGTLTFRNAADLYLYPNTVVIVKATGAEVKDWLECSAGMFNQIDPASDKPQSLLNWEGFRTYNFDVIDGVTYEVDLTQPAKFNGECELVNAKAERIKHLQFDGQPIDPKQTFLVVTNNYRAYGGKFAGTGDDHIVFAAPDENRQVLIDYIRAESEKSGAINPKIDGNWKFVANVGDADIRVETAPTEKAEKFIAENAVYRMEKVDTDAVGFAVYKVKIA